MSRLSPIAAIIIVLGALAGALVGTLLWEVSDRDPQGYCCPLIEGMEHKTIIAGQATIQAQLEHIDSHFQAPEPTSVLEAELTATPPAS